MSITKVSRGLLSTGVSDSSDATAITIDSSENVGIGMTPFTGYTGYSLQIGGTSQTFISIHNTTTGNTVNDGFSLGNDASNVYLTNRENTPIIISTNNTERMRIASSGGVAIGTTTPDGVSNLTVKSQNSTAGQEFVSLHHQASSGTIYFMSFMTGSGSDVGYITFTGTTGAFTAASDISLKENIRDLPEGLDVITQLKPRLFDWKEEGKGSDQVGFIAQEVEEIKPEWIHQKEDIIDNLKARIEVLEAWQLKYQ